MPQVISADFSFAHFIHAAQVAVLAPPTQTSIFAIAEYLDLVGAKEVPPNPALVRTCKSVVQRYVMQHLGDDAYDKLWGRAWCLTSAHNRALKAHERCLNEDMAREELQAS